MFTGALYLHCSYVHKGAVSAMLAPGMDVVALFPGQSKLGVWIQG